MLKIELAWRGRPCVVPLAPSLELKVSLADALLIPHFFPKHHSQPVCLASFSRKNKSIGCETMARTHSESSEDFEFIETPAAPAPTPAPEDCGVKTTSVRPLKARTWPIYLLPLLTTTVSNPTSTPPSKMHLFQQMLQAAIASPMSLWPFS